MAETIWFIGERGVMQCMDRDKMTRPIIDRIKRGELRRVNEDGSPWTGPVFPPPPPDETTISTLRGYRAWRPDRRDGALFSRGSFEWPGGGRWAEALCRGCPVVPSRDACGDGGYGCGLYAASTPTSEVRVYGSVWGVIEAKGRIVMHRRGFRAQFARPVALAIPASAADGEDAGEMAQLLDKARAAAVRYGVPLLPEGALKAEYAPDSWAPRT